MRRAAVLVFVGLVLAGCGGSSGKEQSKSADQIAKDARQAARSATAVHVFGSVVERGRPLTLDLHLVRNRGAVGQMGLGGGTMKLVRVGARVYMNGDARFWVAYGGPQVARVYSGRWLRIPTSATQVAPFVRLTEIDQLFGGAVGAHGAIGKDGTKNYRGQTVIVLKEFGSSGGSLYVAATGKPYPVAIVSPNNGKEGTVSFDQWNKRVAIGVPKGVGASG